MTASISAIKLCRRIKMNLFTDLKEFAFYAFCLSTLPVFIEYMYFKNYQQNLITHLLLHLLIKYALDPYFLAALLKLPFNILETNIYLRKCWHNTCITAACFLLFVEWIMIISCLIAILGGENASAISITVEIIATIFFSRSSLMIYIFLVPYMLNDVISIVMTAKFLLDHILRRHHLYSVPQNNSSTQQNYCDTFHFPDGSLPIRVFHLNTPPPSSDNDQDT